MSMYEPTPERKMRVALLMSGTGTNAERILERAQQDDAAFQVSHLVSNNPDSRAGYLTDRYRVPISLQAVERGDDFEQTIRETFEGRGIDLIALAGYDAILSDELVEMNKARIVNVHPGDLRVRDHDNKPVYTGLGWVPSAKAMLAGQEKLYTTVHIVTPEVDAGPILATSVAVPIPIQAREKSRSELLGDAETLREIRNYTRAHPDVCPRELAQKFPIYGFACQAQEQLKRQGDWVIYPDTIQRIARGEL